MGKQIQFFLDESDFKVCIDFITKQGDMCLNINGKKLVEFNYFTELFKIYIWKDKLKLTIKESFIDSSSSEVIEFSIRKKISGEQRLFPSRFWYETKYWNDEKGSWELKNPELDKKYSIYKKFIQKNFIKNKDNKFAAYCGPGAYELYKKGWKMMQGPIVETHFD